MALFILTDSQSSSNMMYSVHCISMIKTNTLAIQVALYCASSVYNKSIIKIIIYQFMCTNGICCQVLNDTWIDTFDQHLIPRLTVNRNFIDTSVDNRSVFDQHPRGGTPLYQLL